MKTFLAQNQFLSAASLQPVAEAAASSPLGSLSEAAVTNSVSPGELQDLYQRDGEIEPSVMLACAPAGTAAALSRTSVLDAQTDAAAEAFAVARTDVLQTVGATVSARGELIHSLGVVVDRGTAQRLEIELRNAGYFSGPTASGAVWHGENGCSDPATPCDLTRPSQFNDEPALDVPPGPKLPADASVSAGLSDDDLYWQLRFADDPFTRDLAEIPDPHAFFNSIIEIDVWADPAPLFLKRLA